MDTTSWEAVTDWYDKKVGEEGHYYHQHVIIPHLKPLFNKDSNVLDLACGQGILARHLPKGAGYTGVDISPSLIQAAKKYDQQKNHNYHVQDVTTPLPFEPNSFTHAVIVLALQNIAHPEKVLQNCREMLKKKGQLILILNHPCFRIPRQSSWGVDEGKKLQYRRIDHYMTPLKIPIQMQPSKGQRSTQTVSFHRPLSFYSRALHEAGFSIQLIEEWCSDKMSTGKAAKMENRARKEIPLFLALLAQK